MEDLLWGGGGVSRTGGGTLTEGAMCIGHMTNQIFPTIFTARGIFSLSLGQVTWFDIWCSEMELQLTKNLLTTPKQQRCLFLAP